MAYFVVLDFFLLQRKEQEEVEVERVVAPRPPPCDRQKEKKKKTNLSHLSRTCIASMRSISSACWAGGRSGGACIFGLERRGKERALLASACFAQLADWKRARESVFFFFPPLARLLARSRAGTTTKEKKLSSPLSSTSSSCIPSPSSHHGLFCGSPRSPRPGRFDARNR